MALVISSETLTITKVAIFSSLHNAIQIDKLTLMCITGDIMVSVSNAWVGAVLAKELCTAVSKPSKWASEDVVAEVEIDVERIAGSLANKLPVGYRTRVCESGGRIEVIRLNQHGGRESSITG